MSYGHAGRAYARRRLTFDFALLGHSYLYNAGEHRARGMYLIYLPSCCNSYHNLLLVGAQGAAPLRSVMFVYFEVPNCRTSNPFLPELLVTKVQVLGLSDRTGQTQHKYLLLPPVIHSLVVH